MKKLAITFLLFIALGYIAYAWFSFAGPGKKETRGLRNNKPGKHVAAKSISKKIRSKAKEAKDFATITGYNNSICFLIDMSIPSGQNRFFIYGFEKDTVINSGLVTHGRCNETWLEGRRFGNTVGCGCTSLGRYKIGNSYHGRFGLAFKLYGLDKTNSNAYQRYVVLHAHECVPESEVDSDICQSDGCPTVSPGFLEKLEPMIKNSGKPVLLWIFD